MYGSKKSHLSLNGHAELEPLATEVPPAWGLVSGFQTPPLRRSWTGSESWEELKGAVSPANTAAGDGPEVGDGMWTRRECRRDDALHWPRSSQASASGRGYCLQNSPLGLSSPAELPGSPLYRIWRSLFSCGSQPGSSRRGPRTRRALSRDISAMCLKLSPSLLSPPPPFLFASINFLNFRHIPHFLRQIKSSGQGQWKWEEGFHLLEMFSVRGHFLACSGFQEPYFGCSHTSKEDFTNAASSHHLSSARIPDVL